MTTFHTWVWDVVIPLKHRIFLWLAFSLKHRIFLWLAFRGRLNTKDNMVKKGWSEAAPFAHCDSCPAVESIDHLLLRCAPASVLWGKMELDVLACSATNVLSFVEQAQHQIGFRHKWNVAFAACAITLWRARNDRVFNSKDCSVTYTCLYAAGMLRLWSLRTQSQRTREVLQVWRQKLLHSV